MARVLVVDDQSSVRFALSLLLRSHGIDVDEASSPAEAERAVAERGADLVLQDMNFGRGATSGAEGVVLFRRLRALDGALPVVLLTAWAQLETAVQLVREGAADYLAKPWNDDKLIATLKVHLAERESRRLPPSAGSFDRCGLVYQSRAMERLVQLALQVAKVDVPVLILGPSGAGKDRLAQLVQRNSRRSSAPFVRVDTGALPESLLEAELFGAEAGAFTGASKARIGRFEAASRGTLFLDEIGNLSLAGQRRLLRVLQTGEYERLGSSSTRRADVRLISATNADLQQAVRAGAFREDLFYRINLVELRVPPLAERPDDVLPIARSILDTLTQEPGVGPFSLSEGACLALEAHPWPGNVRELENCLKRAALLCPGQVIDVPDLRLMSPGAPPSPAGRSGALSRQELEAALQRQSGNIRALAAELGLSRQALYRRLARLGLSVHAFRDGADGDA